MNSASLFFKTLIITITFLTVFSDSQIFAVTGKLRASMYAVPVNNSTSLGTTRLIWSVSDNSYAQLWVSADGNPEALFAMGISQGTSDASWISQGSHYIFRLYQASGPNESDKGYLLDSAKVTGIPPIQPMVGQNKMDLFMQYLGNTSGCDGSPEYIAVVKRMAKKSIMDAANLGTNNMRIAVSGYGYGEISIWRDDSVRFWNTMDEMFNDLNAFGVKIIPTLIWNVMQFPQLTYTNFRDYITDTNSVAYRQSLKFISEFINRYKNNPAVLYYDLNNEMNLVIDIDNVTISPGDTLAGNVTTDEMIAYNFNVSNFIRSIDPYHMICSGYGCPRSSAAHLRSQPHWVNGGDWGIDNIAQFKQYLIDSHEGLDIVSLHPYNIYNDNERFGYTGHYNVQYIDIMKQASDESLKLLSLGEIGDTNPFSTQDVTCQFSQNVFDKVQALSIPFSAPWILEFYQFDTYSENIFNIDPVFTKPLIEKLIQTNAAMGNPPVTLENPDITIPIMLITWPLTGRTLSDSMQTIYVEASDNNRNISKVEFYLNGNLISTINTYPFNYNLVTDTLPECDYLITAIAYDSTGNYSSDSIFVHGGNLPPCSTHAYNRQISEVSYHVFPNPAKDKIFIESMNKKDSGNISISDIQGQILLQHKLLTTLAEIDISNFAKGIYFLKITGNKRTVVMKIFIQK